MVRFRERLRDAEIKKKFYNVMFVQCNEQNGDKRCGISIPIKKETVFIDNVDWVITRGGDRSSSFPNIDFDVTFPLGSRAQCVVFERENNKNGILCDVE